MMDQQSSGCLNLPEFWKDEFDSSHEETVVTLIRKYSHFIHDIAQENDGLVANIWKNKDGDKDLVKNSTERFEFFQVLHNLLADGCDLNFDNGNGLPLIVAMETFDEELVKLLLKHKADPNQFGIQENMNSLAFSIILDSVELTELLLAYGAFVNDPCCNGITPLQLSVNKKQEISRILFNHGACPQQVMTMRPDRGSVSLSDKPLFTVMKSKNLYLMSVMLEHGEDIDQPITDSCESLIHFAVREGDENIMKFLIHHGANLNKKNKDGVTPLALAFIGGNKENIAKMLLKAGASPTQESFMPDCFNFYDGNVTSRIPPLHIAAHYGYLECVRFIVEKSWAKGNHICQIRSCVHEFPDDFIENSIDGSSTVSLYSCDICRLSQKQVQFTDNDSSYVQLSEVNTRCSLGTTALFHAFLGGHCSVIDYLLSKGAYPGIQCSAGNLIHAAIECYNSTSINLLNLALHFDCDVNLIDSFGYSPLLSASRVNNPDLLELLLMNGAYLNTQDKNGETSLMCSVYFGREENARVLIAHGAELNTADKRGTTALYWSIYNCREKTLRMLIEAGVRFNLKEMFKYPRNLKVMRNEVLRNWILKQISSPVELQQLCRLSIRRHLVSVSDGGSIMKKIDILPLPVKIKCYLGFK